MDLVSIIVPVYNVELYLEFCLKSLINQTYENKEIILIDDGSKDKSGYICDTYAKKYNNIKVIHQKNSGVSVARNNGIKISNGKYILFIDSDDYLEPNTLSYIMEYQYDLLCFGYNKVYKNKIIPVTYKNNCEIENIQEEVLLNNKIGGFLWNKLFKTDIIKNNNIEFSSGIHYCEDLLFIFKYLKYVNKAYYINKCFYQYRMRHSGISLGKYTVRNVSILDVYSYIIDNLKEEKIIKKIKYFYLENYYRLKNVIPNNYRVRNDIINDEQNIISNFTKKDKIKYILVKKYNFIYKIIRKIKRLIYKLYK